MPLVGDVSGKASAESCETVGQARPVNIVVHGYADVNDRLSRGQPFAAIAQSREAT